jgi:hypothetical protein
MGVYSPIHDYGVVVTPEEVEPVLQDIKSHRECWRPIAEWYPDLGLGKEALHAIGSPIYRDATLEMYEQSRQRVEPLINRHAWLRERALSTLIKYHNCNSYEQAPKSSLPGFHVFNTCNGTKNKNYSVSIYHTDTDWIHHYGMIPGDKFWSYVIALELPKHGSGLFYKKHTSSPEESRMYYVYERYHMYGWSAYVPHKFADTYFETDDDYRITFQGHGWFRNDTFYFYW